MHLEHSLEVYRHGKRIFMSDGNWLYPLFQLQEFITAKRITTSEVEVRDKIIGRAAALVLVYLGIHNITAGILSRPGKEILDLFESNYRYNTLIDKVSCRTEELLEHITDPAIAYGIVRERAKL